jgi:hypothetical protein
MERELWPLLYRHLRAVGQDFTQKYVHHQPWVIVAVLLWAALHDRPLSWACDRRHWSTTVARPAVLPSPATVSRRLPGLAVGLLLRALADRLRGAAPPTLAARLDGKALPVSGVSKDPDAKWGRGAGGQAKGYKLHAVWAGRPLPEAWEVAPLSAAETAVARGLVARAGGGGYLLGDGNYDASAVFDAAAAAGYQLLAPAPDPHAGQGHHYQSPHRLRSIALWRGEFGQALYRLRPQIERDFGSATCFAGGLGPLPAWVRRLRRVAPWVSAKLLINAARIIRRMSRAA